ncbi:MAG: 50S ribosomal protein L10 [Candidatus Omnitrophota bacterium]
MVMKRSDKISLSEEYFSILENSSGLVVFEYRGLTVKDITELRLKVREAGGKMRVIRNRMLKRAIEDKPYKGMQRILAGPNAVIFAGKDPVAPAKALVEFAKTHEKVEIKGGMVSNVFVDAKGVELLSKTPPLEQLYAKILGGIKAPANSVLGGVKGLHQKLHGLIKAYADKLGEAA